MAENNNIEVGGRLHSIATGNVLTGANEIFDDDKNKKQSEINTETYSLVNEVNAKLNTLSPEQQSALAVATKANKNEANLGYYVCETEGNVAAKVVANATGYILAAGGSIKIKFNNANTANNATLNINSTGANPLYYDGERASASNTWEAGEIVEVYYDGTNFYANNVAGGGTFASGEKVKNVGIDSEPTAGSENLVKSGGVAKELGELIVEGSGTSSIESTVYYFNKNLGYTIPSGTPFYIEVEGVGNSDDYPVSALIVRLNSSTGPGYTVKENNYITPEVDVTKLMVLSRVSNTRFAGEVKVSVYYKGIKQDIANLQKDVEDIEADVTTLQGNVSDISDDIDSINVKIDGVELVEIGRYEGLPKAYTSSDHSTMITLSNPLLPNTNLPLPVGGKIKVTVTGTDTAINKCSLRVTTPSGINAEAKRGSFDYEVVETISVIDVYTTSSQILDATKPVSVILEYEKSGIVDDIDSLNEDIDEVNTRIDEVNTRIDDLQPNQDFNTDYIVTNFATDAENNEFTNSFSFTIQSKGKVNEPMIISAEAKYINNVDDAVPTIQVQYKSSSSVYKSPAYTVGSKNEYEQKEWRMPPFIEGYTMIVAVTIPANVTLYINEMSNRYSDVVNRPAVGFRMNAHIRQYNFNTLQGFILSAKVGYTCAIVVPKRTSDGVWCCFHDDDNITGLKYPNGQTVCAKTTSEGSTVYTQYDSEGNVIGNSAMPVSSISWSDLSTYIYSDGSHVASLEDFFSVCAKTGMHPMFSWHPLPNAEQIVEVKNLIVKFGLLPYLNIKFGFTSNQALINAMNIVYGVFGDSIESYTGDINNNTSITDLLNALESTDVDKTKVRVGLEFFNSRVTIEKVQATLAAGYFAAIAWMTEDPTGEMMDYWRRNGVTEFTEYRNYSNGLNW